MRIWIVSGFSGSGFSKMSGSGSEKLRTVVPDQALEKIIYSDVAGCADQDLLACRHRLADDFNNGRRLSRS